MKSYIKLFGPPIGKAITKLETITINYPKVCMMNRAIIDNIPSYLGNDIGISKATETRDINTPKLEWTDWVMRYSNSQGLSVSRERCMTLISKAGSDLGEYDFFYEWLEAPGSGNINELIEKIDNNLSSLGCLYTITTK